MAHESLQEHEVGLFSLGGCGRREVFPFSDVDLLFLHAGKTPSPVLEKGIETFLRKLYDLRLSIGQQVWAVEDLKSVDLGQVSFLLALTDGRFIWGETPWADQFEEIRTCLLSRHGSDLVDAIRRVTADRHGEHGNTIYELEPDVKHSPGGFARPPGHSLAEYSGRDEPARGLRSRSGGALLPVPGKNPHWASHDSGA